MRYAFFAALILTLSTALPCTADPSLTAADLHYISEEYRPYNYKEYHQSKGLVTDFLFAMWQNMGVKAQPIDFMPWPRAYEMATQGSATVLFSTIRTPERESRFKWVGPVLTTSVALIGLESFDRKIKTLKDTSGLRIGVIKDYAEVSLLRDHKKELQLDILSSPEIAMNKLMAGRLDLVFFDRIAFEYVAKTKHIPPNSFRVVYQQPPWGVYFALSPSVPDALVQRMQKACDAVRSSPAYAAILKRYLDETVIYTQPAP